MNCVGQSCCVVHTRLQRSLEDDCEDEQHNGQGAPHDDDDGAAEGDSDEDGRRCAEWGKAVESARMGAPKTWRLEAQWIHCPATLVLLRRPWRRAPRAAGHHDREAAFFFSSHRKRAEKRQPDAAVEHHEGELERLL